MGGTDGGGQAREDEDGDGDKEGDEGHNVSSLVHAIGPFERCLLLYLLDLLCAVVIRADVNRMTAQNCAIVLAPNLVGARSADVANPMQALEASQKSVEILQTLIERRLGDCYARGGGHASESDQDHGLKNESRRQESSSL